MANRNVYLLWNNESWITFFAGSNFHPFSKQCLKLEGVQFYSGVFLFK